MKNVKWRVFTVGVGTRYSKGQCLSFCMLFITWGHLIIPEFLSQNKPTKHFYALALKTTIVLVAKVSDYPVLPHLSSSTGQKRAPTAL